MTCVYVAEVRESLYALSWSYAQDGKLAVNTETAIVVDANPAAEAMSGYTRDELIGMHITMLHPEAERERVEAEFRKAAGHELSHAGLHLRRKDGSAVPVSIWSSEALTADGRNLVIAEFRDISDQVAKEQRLSAQNWALSAFSIAALALGRARSATGLLQSICEAITQQSVYVLATVGIAEESPEKGILVAAAAGTAMDYLDGIQLSWSEDEVGGQGPAGACIRTNTLQIIEDTETSAGFAQWRERARQFGIRSCVSIPLRIENGWQGALLVYSAHAHAFESAPLEVFERLGEQIVHGIQAIEHKQLLEAERKHLERTQKNLTDALQASVAAMVTAMEMRDPYTAGHETRVADIAYAIGAEMGWPVSQLEGLRMAAMVHDIGKISIPAEILSKPGRLTAEEYTLVKKHPETGYAILRDIPFSWPIADIVRQHHEKINGSGYPLGLKGNEILPESKVLAVADIVEAMASNRPYRIGIDLDVVLDQIQEEAGTLLDTEAVRICVDLFRGKGFCIPGMNRH
jgi:PAS domain S-box-containing protein/putative nucleotidyltransferase with HDIG domain